ncbi:DUF5067 domain-containing protein [Macrococcus brunensis]|uniref:DUF5067 domain-containing protein n=1 Tax=Macrococcus brunensis TaxID=198483 RepID=A0A4R6BBV7_9STAP|nr:DUF5067 domain-containing protein [Macrococcus brunensis]TDL95323.1 DUF5067 domain-containing protein [Macrococcus brunensis]
MNNKVLAGTVLTSAIILSAFSNTTPAHALEKTISHTVYTIEQEMDSVINGPEQLPHESLADAAEIGESRDIHNLTFTLTKVKAAQEIDASQPEDVVTLYYTVKNTSDTPYYAGQSATIYYNGKTADAYALASDKSATIKPGETAEVSQSFRLNPSLGQFEVEIGPLFDLNGQKALYKVSGHE